MQRNCTGLIEPPFLSQGQWIILDPAGHMSRALKLTEAVGSIATLPSLPLPPYLLHLASKQDDIAIAAVLFDSSVGGEGGHHISCFYLLSLASKQEENEAEARQGNGHRPTVHHSPSSSLETVASPHVMGDSALNVIAFSAVNKAQGVILVRIKVGL